MRRICREVGIFLFWENGTYTLNDYGLDFFERLENGGTEIAGIEDERNYLIFLLPLRLCCGAAFSIFQTFFEIGNRRLLLPDGLIEIEKTSASNSLAERTSTERFCLRNYYFNLEKGGDLPLMMDAMVCR